MLAATALVLLMTPGARALLRGPRAREEHPQHVHDVRRRARGRHGHVGGSSATRSPSTATATSSAASDYAFLNDVTFEPRDGTTIPHLLFMAFQATFCIITVALVSGAVVERMRFGPFLLFAALWSVLVYAVHGALGLRRRLADRGRDARLRGRRPGRDGVRLLRARRRAGRRGAQGLRAPGAAAPQRGLRPARRRPALVRLVRLQRRQRLLDRRARRARLHQHAADAGLHADRLVRARPGARPAGHRDRRGDRDHRRLRRDHARGRLHQPRLGDGARRAGGAPELRSDRLAAAHARGRDARRARRARDRRTDRHPLHRLLCAGVVERRLGRPPLRQRGAARRPGAGGARGAGLRLRGHVRPPEGDRRVLPLRGERARGGLGMDVIHHGEEAYAQRRRRDPRGARRRARCRSRTRPSRARAAARRTCGSWHRCIGAARPALSAGST